MAKGSSSSQLQLGSIAIVLRFLFGVIAFGLAGWIIFFPNGANRDATPTASSDDAVEATERNTPGTAPSSPESCSPGNGATPKAAASIQVVNSEKFGYWIIPVSKVDPETGEEAYLPFPPGYDTRICTASSTAMTYRFVLPDNSEQVLHHKKECVQDRTLCEPFPPRALGMFFSSVEEDGSMEIRIYKK